ncbi:hypothetical protein SLEP1_g28110 [Rubroshorea leprosula]|uniref:Non-haem dioxygenase N-terminal domain-containing protein n=1 Tax=Rubroshorea leprosula TaxID=152421 RepID=A0AAV5K535_9ROSI|nr:hypothetical protein SLEP1_g28110 [Rubroshorea leprosula]
MEKEMRYFHEASLTDQEGRLRTMRIPVVQELARSGIDHLPKRFTRVPPTDRTSYTLNFPPVINVARLKEGSEADGRAAELARLASGVKEWGLVLVTEHGIGSSVLHGVRDAVEGFFGLSFEEKKRCVGSYASVDNLGYGRNFVRSDDQPFDWIDRLAMKAAPPGADGGLDVWPRKPPNFRMGVQRIGWCTNRAIFFEGEVRHDQWSMDCKAST